MPAPCLLPPHALKAQTWRWRAARPLVLAVVLLGPLSLTAGAQTADAGGTAVQVQPLDRLQAEQERLKKLLEGKPKAYEDKVMDPSALPPQADAQESLADPDQLGFRGYVAETRWGMGQTRNEGFAAQSARELGLRTEYRHETLNYGDFVLQADLRRRNGEPNLGVGLLGYANRASSGRFTLRNLGFPITPSTFADTSAGDISSEITDAFSRSYRVSLGNATVRGLSTRVFDRDADLRLGWGQRGSLAGGPYPGFERSQGTLLWAGYTRRFPDNRYAGVQLNRATGVNPTLLGTSTGPTEDVTSVAAAIGYGRDLHKDGDSKARLTLIGNHTSGSVNRSAHGIFVEGGLRLAGFRHELGVYTASPHLRFGDYAPASDNRGAYWRVDRSASRLNWGAGLDVEQLNPGQESGRLSSTRIGLNGQLQYQVSRDTLVGGHLTLTQTRHAESGHAAPPSQGTRSLNTSAYYQTRFYDWGRSRVSLLLHRNETLVANDLPATGEELQWEHDWITGKYETLRPEFVTQLGYARDRSSGLTQTYPTAGLLLRYWVDASWSLGGSLRYTSRSSHLATSRGLSGTLTTERVLPGGWRLGMDVSLNQAVVDAAPSTPGTPQVIRSNDKSVSLYLRWEGARGTPYQAAGLRNAGAAGGGGISGQVFFDTNRDGQPQMGENGVPNVEVVLDGRYRATTDREGRFEFPLVATGRHRLSLTPESVPLPWGPTPDADLGVDVPLRGVTSIRIPVVRVGD